MYLEYFGIHHIGLINEVWCEQMARHIYMTDSTRTEYAVFSLKSLNVVDVLCLGFLMSFFRKKTFVTWFRKSGMVKVFWVAGMIFMILFLCDGIVKKNGRLGTVFFWQKTRLPRTRGSLLLKRWVNKILCHFLPSFSDCFFLFNLIFFTTLHSLIRAWWRRYLFRFSVTTHQ